MSQPVKSTSKYSRKVGENLFLKGQRDEGQKTAITRRPFPPGQHGQSRHGKLSDYGKQLQEKQKARWIYNMSERQLRRFIGIAQKSKDNTGVKLMQLLESRVDNVLYRSGFADSRRQARQAISHGLVKLNNKNIKTASILLKAGDKLTVTKKIINNDTVYKKPDAPDWLEVDNKSNSVTFTSIPARTQILTPLEEQLIVEYYSRLT